MTGAEQREAALRSAVTRAIEERRPEDAVTALVALTGEAPDRLEYWVHLASLLENLGRLDLAIDHYRRLIALRPDAAAAHFNLALLYKKDKRHGDAIAAYEEALKLGIRDAQEVWSNMGVVYSELHQAGKSAAMYRRALDVDPRYVPALFNYAGLLEETGERERAIELYRRILSIDSRHWAALARLAHASRVTADDDRIVDSLRAAIGEAEDEPAAREELSFALGKSFDDLGRYEEAFAAYRAANELGKRRNPPYDRAATEAAFDRLIGLFTAEWIERVSTGRSEAPVFICGMFRSGSTLVEQILAAHPSVTAGGELDSLARLTAARLAPFPEGVHGASREQLLALGNEYLAKLAELFPGAGTVTDKRPDNFLHLGLVRALFPRARIVYTRRNPRDNCLSVYFQQLGGNLFYATDLGDTAHYYRQHERLMAHWKASFPENIFMVDYDALVRSPEAEVRPLLDFLGLDWNERCLAFQEADRLVKTASVWQVREALHTRSSERWRNYEPFMAQGERTWGQATGNPQTAS